jgi:beta-glucosidase
MKNPLLSLLFVVTVLLNGGLSAAVPSPCEAILGAHAAVTPVPKDRAPKWWMLRHREVLARVAQGDVDLLMIGDSITHFWENRGKAVWDQYYAPRNAVNLGFSADRTEHVLWRLQNGEIDHIHPKLAVLMIGTNNSNGDDYTVEQIADGIKAIVCTLRTKLPETNVLILAIFPRGDAAQKALKTGNATYNAQWEKNDKASQIASQLADGKRVFFLDINKTFLNGQGELPREIMPDLLHPQAKGYALWAEAIEPTVARLLGESR